MQARKTLMRWLHVVQTGAALAIMLSAKTDPELDALARIGGWRKEIKPSTPGLVKQALAGAFVQFRALAASPHRNAISVEKPECTDHQIASGQSGGLNVLPGLTFPLS